MAAYFVKVSYPSYRARDIYYDSTCIISFDKFERVDEESFFEKVKGKFPSYAQNDIKIKDVVKL